MEATQSDLNSLSIDNDSTLSSSEIYQANTRYNLVELYFTNNFLFKIVKRLSR